MALYRCLKAAKRDERAAEELPPKWKLRDEIPGAFPPRFVERPSQASASAKGKPRKPEARPETISNGSRQSTKGNAVSSCLSEGCRPCDRRSRKSGGKVGSHG